MTILFNFRLYISRSYCHAAWRRWRGYSDFSSRQHLYGGHTQLPRLTGLPISAGPKSRATFPALPAFETSTPLCVHKACWSICWVGGPILEPLGERSCLGLLLCNEVFCLRSSVIQRNGGMVAPCLSASLLLACTQHRAPETRDCPTPCS